MYKCTSGIIMYKMPDAVLLNASMAKPNPKEAAK
jgi:hypothetical protein